MSIPEADVNATNKDGKTALDLAVSRDHYNTVSYLLRRDAKITDYVKQHYVPNNMRLFTLCQEATPKHNRDFMSFFIASYDLFEDTQRAGFYSAIAHLKKSGFDFPSMAFISRQVAGTHKLSILRVLWKLHTEEITDSLVKLPLPAALIDKIVMTVYG